MRVLIVVAVIIVVFVVISVNKTTRIREDIAVNGAIHTIDGKRHEPLTP
jgi:hypothetical protein